jgi:hypothetical protein
VYNLCIRVHAAIAQLCDILQSKLPKHLLPTHASRLSVTISKRLYSDDGFHARLFERVWTGDRFFLNFSLPLPRNGLLSSLLLLLPPLLRRDAPNPASLLPKRFFLSFFSTTSSTSTLPSTSSMPGSHRSFAHLYPQVQQNARKTRPKHNREIPVLVRRVGAMLGQMRARGAILCQMIFALTIHALSTARVYTMLILRALPAQMALLLTNKTHGKLETVSNARLWAHPH